MIDEDFDCRISDREWDNFVYSHPEGNVFQTRAISNVYADTKNYSPVHVAVIDSKSQEIAGLMAGVRIREISGLLGVFSEHSIVQGGPLVSDSSNKDLVKELIEKYDSVVCNSSLYNEIRNMTHMRNVLNICDN